MKSLIPALFTVGALMVLFGAAVYITGWEPAPYVYTIGATMVALAQINSPSKSNRANVKRLRRQQIFGALLLVLTGALKRMDCMSDGCCHTGVVHGYPYSTGRGERITLKRKSYPDIVS